MERDPIRLLDETEALIQAASARRLELVAEIAERKLWAEEGASSTSGMLAARYGLARATAEEWVRVANALRVLPAVKRAFEEGRLSWDQLRPVVRIATEETDEEWAGKAPRHRPVYLWHEYQRRRRVKPKDERTVHAARFLDLSWDTERSAPRLYLQGMLGAEQGAVLEAALSRRAEALEVDEDALDRAGARRADALVGLCASGGTGEAAPATLVVHADAAVVAGGSSGPEVRLAETSSGTRLGEEAVRRLACDASVEWVLESKGRSVGIGRRGRVIPGWLARQIQHRDRGCRFPGCEHKRWLKAHHIRHWGQGGTTDVANLVMLCHAHHRLVHEGGWGMKGNPEGELRFHDPTGRVRARRMWVGGPEPAASARGFP